MATGDIQAPMYGEVAAVEQLTPRMVRIVLGGGNLAAFQPTPFSDQYVNCLFLPDGAPYTVPFDLEVARAAGPGLRPTGRRYTIRSHNTDQNQVTIDFVVHGDTGTAGRWANNARPGDPLQFTGPSGAYTPDPEADWYLMVGDESALPAIAASLERVPASRTALAIVVVDNAHHELTLACPGNLAVHWVHRDTDPGNHDLLPAAVAALDLPPGTPDVFVHGEASEVRAVRRHLIAERGIPRDGTSISPYWRRDFTDETWRAVKRDWLAAQEHDA